MKSPVHEILKICIGFTCLLAVLILYLGIWSLETGFRASQVVVSSLPAPLWASCGLLLLGALLSNQLRKRSVYLASWVLSLAVSAGVFATLAGLSNPYTILALLLPVVYAIFLFEWKPAAAFIALNVGGGIVLNARVFQGGPVYANLILPALLVVLIAGFIALVVQLLFSDLAWYEKNYVSANQKERIIRENEAKLERLVKDLVDYQNYLNLTNQLLARAQDEAEKARNAKQIFAQNVSHELRTPLNLIIGFSETMFNTPNSYAAVNWTPELKTDVECIYRNSQHLKSMIDDVLDLASLENRSYEINPVEVDLNGMILEAALISRDRYGNKGLFLTTDLEDRPVLVYADPVRIRQVILNLLSNALKYTSRGGVTITTRHSLAQALVEVKDSGKGIPEEALDKVFEAFYQVDKSRNRDDSGTGLGLTISKQLIELHGGKIHIASTLGQGTQVSFSLPYAGRQES